jgi:hypothetical protein
MVLNNCEIATLKYEVVKLSNSRLDPFPRPELREEREWQQLKVKDTDPGVGDKALCRTCSRVKRFE